MGEKTVNFNAVSDMLERISKTKKLPVKRKTFRAFLDHFYTDREYFSVMRLVLPELDRERGNYGLKESVLAKCLADALGLAKGSKDAEKLINWRKGGSQVGKNAGNFALIAAEVVGSRQSRTSGNLKVKQVNDALDQLAEVKGREEKSKILAEVINKTNAVEMKWLIMIILKDLKLGMSEKTVFKEFHPDADEVYNKTCDLKLVCEKLVDPRVRFKRQDIEVGKAVRPQLACRVKNVEEAWKKLRGKRVIAECKFDGDRCQVHKDGNNVNFFSRSSIDHKEFADAMRDVICDNVSASKCILDGEMVVWNRVTNKFAEFGTIQEIAKHARNGIETDEQLCYIIFDILYIEDCSVIHQPLCERQKLLQQKVKPVSGRLELLRPDQRNCGGQLWSVSAQSVNDIEGFFQMTIENREEGIVIKDFDSKWEPGDRSGKWLKLKPDYVHPESDLDVLIIGGYYGSGRRGGEVAQFLLGLAERPTAGYPTKFLSFCKVGTGLSDDECKILVDKLRPYFRKYDKNTKPPSYYVVTNNSKERPDVWIDQPDKSVILQIASDIRCIKSEVFASPYSLRFPRVHRVRYDKPWNECLDVQSLVEMVTNRNGNMADVNQEKKRKQEKSTKKKPAKLPLLAPDMQQTDVSGVKKESDLFRGLVFFFVNVSHADKEKFHRLAVQYGGKFSMNLNGEVTHVVSENRKGLYYDAATKRGDVIHCSWFLDSVANKELLPLRPKYMLHLSSVTKEKFKDTLDEFGDHYFIDVDETDMSQLFGYMNVATLNVDSGDVLQYKAELGSRNIFEGSNIYFHRPSRPQGDDRSFIADIVLQRLQVEVQMYKGAVSTSLGSATLVVVFSEPGSETEDCAFSEKQRRVLSRERIPILRHAWVEDSLKRGILLPEDGYALDCDAVEMDTGLTFSQESSPPEQVDTHANGEMHSVDETPSQPEELDSEEYQVNDMVSSQYTGTENGDTLSMEELLLGIGRMPREERDDTLMLDSRQQQASQAPHTVKLKTSLGQHTEPHTVTLKTSLGEHRATGGEPTMLLGQQMSATALDPIHVSNTCELDFNSVLNELLPGLQTAKSDEKVLSTTTVPVDTKTYLNDTVAKAQDGTPLKRKEEVEPPKKKSKVSYKDRIADFLM